MDSTQLDLFGRVEALERHAADQAAQRKAAQARRQKQIDTFRQRATIYPDGTRVIWTPPTWEPPYSNRSDEPATGWWCWLCHVVSPNEFVMSLNHGLGYNDQLVYERTACTNIDRRAFSRESRELSSPRRIEPAVHFDEWICGTEPDPFPRCPHCPSRGIVRHPGPARPHTLVRFLHDTTMCPSYGRPIAEVLADAHASR
jgi:hypothetical protein